MLRRRRVRATEESEELHSEGEDEIQDKKLSHASVFRFNFHINQSQMKG